MAQTLKAGAENSGEAAAPPPAGHNGLDAETFARFVHQISQADLKVEEARSARKNVRKQAKAAGIELGHLDAIVRMAEWSAEEVRAYFGTQAQYALWYQLPIDTQAELFVDASAKPVEEPHGAGYWSGKGYQAGVKGVVGTPPSECHPQHHQDWLHGWGQGQAKLAPAKLQAVN